MLGANGLHLGWMFIHKHICTVYTWIGSYINRPKRLCNLIIRDCFNECLHIKVSFSFKKIDYTTLKCLCKLVEILLLGLATGYHLQALHKCYFINGSNSFFIKQLDLVHNARLGANRIKNVQIPIQKFRAA